MTDSHPLRFAQRSILEPPPAFGHSVTYRVALEADPRKALARLKEGFVPDWGVVGIGEPLARLFGAEIDGLRPFPALAGPGQSVPSTQQALWFMLRGADRSATFDLAGKVADMLEGPFVAHDPVDTFTYREGRDLSGYVDGTANPSYDDSIGVAFVPSGAGLIGSSFVAVQRWRHDLKQLARHPSAERDAMVGRRIADNEEIAGAPPSAHVKRSEQEDYDPPAFMVRRSMPWAAGEANGLEFIAYGASPEAYERVMRRMLGLDDGVTDAIFKYSRATAGGYYWCPPIASGRLDLSRLGL